MGIVKRKRSKTFNDFFHSEKSSGILLIICTIVSLLITNSIVGARYLSFWQTHVGGLSIEHWINDALMAIFFWLIGLELEREFYIGELSDFRNTLLPIFAAAGGMTLTKIMNATPIKNSFAGNKRASDVHKNRSFNPTMQPTRRLVVSRAT